jgi:AraC family transcriptional regulator
MLHISEQSYPAGLEQKRHAHDATSVTIVLRGSLLERVGEAEEIARPLSIVVKPCDTEHANRFGPKGARTLQIYIPPAEFTRMEPWQASLGSWRWQHAPRSTVMFLRLLSAVREYSCDTDVVQSFAFDALAALAPDCNALRVQPSWLKQIREAIDDACNPPRLSDLARLASVHPVYLARQFRRGYGCSVSEYIHRRRIQKAAELSSDRSRTLSTVAHGAGFSDQAHMCRVFRKQLRLTPQKLRTALSS